MANDFLSAIFGGSNPTLNADINKSGADASWDTGQGEGDITAGTDFLKSIISGDATKTSQALAPQISAAKTSAQQDQKTATEMGNRGGGTNATNASMRDKIHGYITNLIGQLTGSAATALPSIGTNLTSQGTAATAQQSAEAQQRFKNWQDSILGKSIGTGVGAAEGFGLGKAFPATPGASPTGAPSSPGTTVDPWIAASQNDWGQGATPPPLGFDPSALG